MEDDGIRRVKKSLGLFLKLVWFFGVPHLGVRYIWRLTYALVLSLLYSVMLGFLLHHQITLMCKTGVNDVGALLSAQSFSFMYAFAMTFVWVTRGANIVQATIVDLAEVDVVIRDLKVMKKNNLSLRQSQVFWIGLFLFWCSTELVTNVVLDHFELTKILPAISTSHHSIDWSFSIASGLQLLTLDILFSSIILAIRDRFQIINIALYKTGEDYDLSKTIFPNRGANYIVVRDDRLKTAQSRLEKLISELDALCEIHKRLRDIAGNLNGVFSATLLLALLTGLASSLASAYVVAVLAHGCAQSSYVYLCTRVFTLFYDIFKPWMVVWSCSGLVTEANKLGVLLHRINLSGEPFYRKLRELSMKHHQEKMKIVAGGVLSVDYSWLKLVFFTVTAYAILIFQQNSSPVDLSV